MILLLSVCSIGFLIYGALVVSGIYTPIKDPCGGRRAGKMVPHRGRHKDALGAGSGILCHVPMQRISGSFMAGGISCADGGYYHHGI